MLYYASSAIGYVSLKAHGW